ncbi:hypothetical protein KFL_002250080 [Klebsormidium nitens]|uniref:Uncharacterized protein n=1 Tax=Klebsormidium nitens TaxID=105231 RepID=A0A1Y1IAU9_KLENI|nr:hypothetical protein KFL_002250080 [Klebsormidium nitens]|eukprot:GAQ85228.1 hypothetical protein KFL_002250080 [Klebsormidium nitens]
MSRSGARSALRIESVLALRRQETHPGQVTLHSSLTTTGLQRKLLCRTRAKCRLLSSQVTSFSAGQIICDRPGPFSGEALKKCNFVRFTPWRTGKVTAHSTGEEVEGASNQKKLVEGALNQKKLSHEWIRAERVLQQQAEESRRPDALYQDTIAGPLLEARGPRLEGRESVGALRSEEQMANALATRYVDDTLLATVENEALNVKQVVFLSSGAETRPYRLRWPASTVFFEVAPAAALSQAQALAKAAGVNVPRGRMLVRVEADWEAGGEHWAKQLTRRAYQGTKPSVWVLQGCDVSPSALLDLLLDIGDLAHAHAILVGQLPTSALPSDKERSPEAVASRLFAEHGFSFEVIDRQKLAEQYAVDASEGGQDYTGHMLFEAVQRRLSQAQLEALQPQIENMEEDRDGEEGFEDLW